MYPEIMFISRLSSSPMGQPLGLKTAQMVSGQVQGMPMISGTVQMPMGTQGMMTPNPNGGMHHGGIPLTQPLVINTSFGGQMSNAQTVTMTAPVQVPETKFKVGNRNLLGGGYHREEGREGIPVRERCIKGR